MHSFAERDLRGIPVDDLLRLYTHGVGADYVGDLVEAGYQIEDIDAILRLYVHGIGAKTVDGYRTVPGFDLSTEDVVRLHNRGIDPRYLREVAGAGLHRSDLDDVLQLHAHGVDPRVVSEWTALGIDGVDAVIRLNNHGVRSRTIAELHRLGYDRLSVDEAIQLNNNGVGPGFVRKLVEAGFEDLSVDELIDIYHRGEADMMIRRRASLSEEIRPRARKCRAGRPLLSTRGEQVAALDRRGHGVVVGVQRAIHVEMLDDGAAPRRGPRSCPCPWRSRGSPAPAPRRWPSMASTPSALSSICRVLSAPFKPTADEVLLVGRGGNRLDAGGRAEDALLGDQHVGRVLAEHQPGVHAGPLGQEGGQAHAQRRVEQAVEPALGEHADHRDAGADHVQRHADRRPLEVGPGEHLVVVGQEDRVVGHAVQLGLDLLARVGHEVAQRADDLRVSSASSRRPAP